MQAKKKQQVPEREPAVKVESRTISAWRTEVHDVLPSDRTRPELKAISVAAQQLLNFAGGDDRSINTKNGCFLAKNLPFIAHFIHHKWLINER